MTNGNKKENELFNNNKCIFKYINFYFHFTKKFDNDRI